MCGIAGILLAPNATSAKPLRAIVQMTTALRHRGPDGEGFWTDREAGIAFGRRSVDLVSILNQPNDWVDDSHGSNNRCEDGRPTQPSHRRLSFLSDLHRGRNCGWYRAAD